MIRPDGTHPQAKLVARFYTPLRLPAITVLFAALEQAVGTTCSIRAAEGGTTSAFEIITHGDPLPTTPRWAEQLAQMSRLAHESEPDPE